jgi:hypothetical protein
MAWVKLEHIQFVGACNPPTDPVCVPLSHRFRRHAPLVMADYPGEVSLKQIYGMYNRALLKVVPTFQLDVQLVLFNDVLDHVLRINQVFRQVQEHLLIGVSGSGKASTTFS